MKTTLFQRPNLKIFLLAALVIVIVKELVVPADTQALHMTHATQYLAGQALSDTEMNLLVESTFDHPTAENFYFVSACYMERGDYNKAMHFMRKARFAEDSEE